MDKQNFNRGLIVFIFCLFLKIPNVQAFSLPEVSPPPYCYSYDNRWFCNVTTDLERDFITYFEPCNLLWFGNFFIASAILANTGWDRSFQHIWERDVSSYPKAYQFFNYFNRFGNAGYYGIGIYLASMGVGYWQNCTLTGNVLYNWGYRSLRTFVLGGIQQIILTNALGSGRPSRGEPSKWQPFRYHNAVSGHAMYGAIPFITAAMMTDPPLLRLTLYAVSTLPGLARINNNTHYLSQVLLGWAIAYLSAKTVYLSDQLKYQRCHINVYPKYDGGMVQASWKF